MEPSTQQTTRRLDRKSISHAQRGEPAAISKLAEETVARLGERIRQTRVQLGLTLRQVAKTAGVSAGTVQKIESGRLVPSVAVFVKIAKGLHRRASYFLGDDDEEARADVRIVRKGSGRVLPTESDIRIEAIAELLRDSQMEAYLITIPPGAKSGEPLGYNGELIFHCKRGTVTFQIRRREETLRPGDTLHLKAEIPHKWSNRGNRPAEMLVAWSKAS